MDLKLQYLCSHQVLFCENEEVMNMKNTTNLLEGSILGKLAKLALPIMLTSFIQMAYNLVDMIWVGKLGSAAVASVGAAGIFLWIADSCYSVAKMGGQIKVAHAIGEGDQEKARYFAVSAFRLGGAIAALFILLVIFGHQLMVSLFQLTDPKTHNDAVAYLLITGTAGVFFSMVNQVFTGLYTGIGDSKSPFWVTAAGLILNLVLDPVLIFGLGPIPALGVAGAAIATAGSQGIVTLLFLVMVFLQKGFFRSLPLFKRLDRTYLKQTWKMGLPIGIQNVFMSGLSLIIASIVASWGANAVAVQKVGGQVESLSWMISGGFSMAVNAFIGQNYGAKKIKRVKSAYQTATVLMLIWGTLCTLALTLLPSPIFQIFIREDAVLPMGVSYLQILGISQLFMCIEASSTGAFNGLGETKIPSVVSIVFNLMRIPLALLLSRTSLGLDGIWWAISISSICKGIILTTWYFIYIRKHHLLAETEN